MCAHLFQHFIEDSFIIVDFEMEEIKRSLQSNLSDYVQSKRQKIESKVETLLLFRNSFHFYL